MRRRAGRIRSAGRYRRCDHWAARPAGCLLLGFTEWQCSALGNWLEYLWPHRFHDRVGIGLAIAPGPLQLIHPSIPNAVAGLYPTVLIPAFAVPSSILLHVLSLRQLRRTARQPR
jgi:hypothetical protein